MLSPKSSLRTMNAVTDARMIGKIACEYQVISITSRNAVTIAPVVAASVAAMPIKTSNTGSNANSGSKIWSNALQRAPSVAPKNKAGAKMPPDAPEPSVKHVVRSLAAKMTTNSHGLLMIKSKQSWMVAKPIPSA